MPALSVKRPLTLSAVSLAAFGAIAAAVTWLPATAQLDESVAAQLNYQAVASPAAVHFFRGVTYLGTSPFMIDLSIGIVIILLLYRHWRLAVAWVIAELICIVLIEKTKLAFGRSRPSFNGMFALEDS